MTNILD